MGCVLHKYEENHPTCGGYKGGMERLEKLIANRKLVVFSKLNCPASWELKRIFHEHGVTYTVVELDNCNELEIQLFDKTGNSQIPQVFFRGKYIGGLTDMKRMQYRGKLWELVGKKLVCPENSFKYKVEE